MCVGVRLFGRYGVVYGGSDCLIGWGAVLYGGVLSRLEIFHVAEPGAVIIITTFPNRWNRRVCCRKSATGMGCLLVEEHRVNTFL